METDSDSRILTYKPIKYTSIEQKNKNLLNIINELKEENVKLKEKAERDKYEILILKQQIKTRTKNIDKLTDELNSAKQENIQIAEQMKVQEQGLQILVKSKIAEIRTKDSEIYDLNQELSQLRKKLLKEEYEKCQSTNSLKEPKKPKTNHEVWRKFSKHQNIYDISDFIGSPLTKPTVSLVKDIDDLMEKSFSWTVIDVHNKREIGEPLKSDYFFVRMNPYKFQLVLVNYATTMNIRLLVHASRSDGDLKWPLLCEVVIKIVNSSIPLEFKKLKDDRSFDRPQPNSFKTSQAFVFSYLDLFTSQLLALDSFTIECYIVIKN